MHTDPELLSLLALGESAGTAEDVVHAQACPECARELAELRRVVALARTITTETTLLTPSPDVWARISDELSLGPARRSADELRAEALLAPIVASWSAASGRAEIATDELGRRVMQVALQADLPSAGVRQAWLVHRKDPSLRLALGMLDGLHGLWSVDHSIDLEEYAILDISQQVVGETQHSGETIVRGQFTLIS